MSSRSLDAKHYNNNSETQCILAKKLLNNYCFLGNENILDIGCGSGAVTNEIALMTPNGKVLGIDPSNEMITFASELFSSQENLIFKNGFAEEFLKEQQYNLITAFSCLHWIKDLPKLFEAIYSNLPVKGHFMGITFPAESVYWNMILDVANNKHWKDKCNDIASKYWLSSSNYLSLIDDLNFSVELFKTSEELASYETKESLVNYIKGWLPCLIDFKDQTGCEQFLNDVADLAWDRFFKDEVQCIIPFTKLEFILRKG